MAEVRLEMEFSDVLGKSHKVKVNDPRADLIDTEVFTVMDHIITANALTSRNGDLVSKVGARVVTVSIEEMEV